MRVLLDTQVFIQAYLGEQLPKRVLTLIANPETERILSAASVMEIAVKNATGKLQMPEPQMQQAVLDLRLTVVPFEPRHAYRLFSLPPHHRDPFDRMIIATALAEKLPLIGGDRLFQHYKGLTVIWN
ncbi:MAG: type II toxin-antitoxin system VapC family toxin [Acidobacteriota bacterium]|nr:type II toxin-antitoxin system VapC family toxin [Acidobacteriota bacterium]